MPEALYLPPHALLFETGIREQNLQDFDIHGEMGCFPIADARSDFPMDIFAACFYFLSRYEEYLPFTPDKHGRFRAEESWAYRKNVLDKALVDRWVDLLRRKLSAVCPALSFKQPASTFLPTYDIDVAFAYAHKSVAVQFASMCKSLLKGDFREMGSRWRVWTGKEQDPYDVYDWLSELHRQYGLHPLYFVLFASRSRYDRGLPPKNAAFVRWLRHVASQADVGVHASYCSAFQDETHLCKEVEQLSRAMGKTVKANRSHYLRIAFPETYRHLLHSGISDDYSMGFVYHPGFRAGTCTPFAFYDLSNEEATALTVHPLLFMENGLAGLHTASPTLLFEKVRPLLDEVLRYGGELVTLFHNQSFGSKPGYQLPAKEIYQNIITYVLQNGAVALD